MTLPVYEETKQALGFDPGAEHEFDTELPPDLYPSTVGQWLTFLHQEAPHVITGTEPTPTDDDVAGGGETVPGAHDDSAQMGETGAADSDPDPGASPTVPSE